VGGELSAVCTRLELFLAFGGGREGLKFHNKHACVHGFICLALLVSILLGVHLVRHNRRFALI
jgi:hypothetical protein